MQAKNKRKSLLVIAIGVITLVIISLGGFLYYQVNLQPITSLSETVEFEVIEGDSVGSVITRLEDEAIIKNASVAKLYARFNGLHNIKVGFFQLDKAWNSGEVLTYLNDAKNAGEHEIVITFREGIWAKDIAKSIEENLQIPADDMIALWNDDAYLQTLIEKYDFLDERILNEQVRIKLEGYLYPETYHFSKEDTKEEITEVFLDQFQMMYDEIKPTIEASSMSLHEIITLSSMVQYEAKSEEDMYLIAGVFHNRLKIDMALGSSVTICYALYEDYKNAEDCEVNTNIDSPYNTYMNTGLPVGPILNPGKVSILATIQPKESDYLYFMADIYGDSTVYYAKTKEEHDANVNKYLR